MNDLQKQVECCEKCRNFPPLPHINHPDCPCHSTAPTEEWEKELEAKINPAWLMAATDNFGWDLNDLKSFIRTLLHKAREEERENSRKDLELWLLRLHNEPDKWTVKQALDALTARLPSPPQE